ncbi:MAG: substrate-binding domain-containing protein [Verrucomicrobiae bacterium]|nr:substrate-binding domain-containing protein [Verrucomicrobiae bacterium]
MAGIERKTAAELAAELIRAEIRAGRWSSVLPGTRLLAEETGVSAPTVSAALALLENEGLLERGGERRAFRVRARSAAPRKSRREIRTAAVLTHADVGDLPHTTRRVIESIRFLLVRSGWRMEIRTFDFLHAKRPHRSWNKLVPPAPEIPMVAVFGRPAIAEWAETEGRRMMFLGGFPGDTGVPMVGVKSALLVEEAIARLTALGHQHIVMPLCDRPPSFAASLKEAMRSRIEQAGFVFVPSYHCPESDYQQPGVIWNMMESAFRLKPPTAVVALDWKEMVTISCFVAKLGLRIPKDISLVVLNEQMEADWFVPKLACFRFPVNRLAKTVANWVTGKEIRIASDVLGADFEEGESIGPAPDC